MIIRWIGLQLFNTNIQTLRERCPKLRSIFIEYPEADENFELLRLHESPTQEEITANELHQQQDFPEFTNLRDLSLRNLYGDILTWTEQIVKVMRNSPQLRILGLGLSRAIIIRMVHNWPQEWNKAMHWHFFTQICDGFAGTGALPLSLKSLRCGRGFWPSYGDSVGKLTDYVSLEEVSIHNCGFSDWAPDYLALYDNDIHECGIDFATFGIQNCPNMRRFSAHIYMKDVEDVLLNMTKDFSRQVAVSFAVHDEDLEYDVARLCREDPDRPELPLQLRMLDLDIWRDDDDPEMMPAEQALDFLVKNSAQFLEGLILQNLHLPENEITDDSLDLEWLGSRITRLPKLTQLAVNTAELLYRKSADPPRFLLQAAQKLVEFASTRLRFISIHSFCWEVLRAGDDTWRLEQLDQREIQRVELFHLIGFRDW